MKAAVLRKKPVSITTAVIKFAGDSGDGIQTIGELFASTCSLTGRNIVTFPDFPAEIRAPQGTLPGVSGFQIHFGSEKIFTPGDWLNTLVAFNPAALKANLPNLRPKGILVVNASTFTREGLHKAGYEDDPLPGIKAEGRYNLIIIEMTVNVKEALADIGLPEPKKGQCKNFYALGFVYSIYQLPHTHTQSWIEEKWSGKTQTIQANSGALASGFILGQSQTYKDIKCTVNSADIAPGIYRKVSGNQAFVTGLAVAAAAAGKELIYASYPITPASSILEGLAALKNFNIKSVQTEDEISAIGVAIGASYAGQLGVTGTSGPGLCLKSEFLNLAVMSEVPLVVINVQRAGPSTGLPTKTEQADLLQALWGRNGESPLPVFAPLSPSDCFDISIQAVRTALTFNTPVMILSDNYLANSTEPWLVPNAVDITPIKIRSVKKGQAYLPYKRDKLTFSRTLAYPGTPGLEHKIGGLEKLESGDLSYDPVNHQKMVNARSAKVESIAKTYAPTVVEGAKKGELLVLSWGGTYGTIRFVLKDAGNWDQGVGHVHLRHLNPLPGDLGSIIKKFKTILIPELNSGHLALLIRSKYLVDAKSLSKVEGIPFTIDEMRRGIWKAVKK